MPSLIVLFVVAAAIAMAGSSGRAKALSLTPEQAVGVPAERFEAWRAARAAAFRTLTLLPIAFTILTVVLTAVTSLKAETGDALFLAVLSAVVFGVQSRKANKLKQA